MIINKSLLLSQFHGTGCTAETMAWTIHHLWLPPSPLPPPPMWGALWSDAGNGGTPPQHRCQTTVPHRVSPCTVPDPRRGGTAAKWWFV